MVSNLIQKLTDYDSKVLYGGCQKVVPMSNYFFGKNFFQLRRPLEYKFMANKTGWYR